MNRTLACIAVVLGVLLLAGQMRAQVGGAQPAPRPRKVPSSVGRLLNASPEENAARLTFLTKLERPVTVSVVDKPLRECIGKVLEAVDIRPVFDEQAIDDDGSISLDDLASVRAESEPARIVLERVFRKPALACMRLNTQLVVTTQTESDARLESLVYDVTDLVTDARGRAKPWALARIISSVVLPDSWEDVGGAGAIQWLTSPRAVLLIVRQTGAQHTEITNVLTTLREMGLSSFPTGDIVELPRPPEPPKSEYPVTGMACPASSTYRDGP